MTPEDAKLIMRARLVADRARPHDTEMAPRWRGITIGTLRERVLHCAQTVMLMRGTGGQGQLLFYIDELNKNLNVLEARHANRLEKAADLPLP